MRLVVLIPTEVVLDETVQKIVAEAEDGWFCLEPRHIDFVTALVPGVLNFVTEQGHEAYLAVDEGTLVKCGAKVLVSTSRAVRVNCFSIAEIIHTEDLGFFKPGEAKDFFKNETKGRGVTGFK